MGGGGAEVRPNGPSSLERRRSGRPGTSSDVGRCGASLDRACRDAVADNVLVLVVHPPGPRTVEIEPLATVVIAAGSPYRELSTFDEFASLRRRLQGARARQP